MKAEIGSTDDGSVTVSVTDGAEGVFDGIQGAGASRVHGVRWTSHPQPVRDSVGQHGARASEIDYVNSSYKAKRLNRAKSFIIIIVSLSVWITHKENRP
jgi:hypothetical protein